MKTILRYDINEAINKIDLPIGYKILSVGIAEDEKGRESISMWCEVDTIEDSYETEDTDDALILVFGTGANMDCLTNFDYKFIGTVQKSNKYAFHVIQAFN